MDKLKPGDDFQFGISKDAKGHEVARIDDKTTGQSVKVHDDGRSEQKDAPEQANRPGMRMGR
jgi:hypothetical protein